MLTMSIGKGRTIGIINDYNISMKGLHSVTFILLIIGGLNWLLATFGWEIGSKFLGGMDSGISKIVYLLVGLSAIYEVATHKSRCRNCNPEGGMGMK